MKKSLIGILMVPLVCMFLLTGCSSACKAEGCENERKEGSKYCTEHICAETDCLEGRVGEIYCEVHFACDVEECTNERMLDVQFCADHKCIEKSCPNERSGKYYCKEHFACVASDCENERLNDCDYCEVHKCILTSCKNVKLGESEYCEEHKCQINSCLDGQTSGSVYCQRHKAEEEARIAAEKEANKKKALGKLRAKYDEFDETTWYYPQSAPKYINRKAFYPYIGYSDSGHAWLRWKIVYFGDDWIFFDKIIMNVDGENYTKTFEYGEVERDNNTDVWEYVDLSVSESDKALLKKIANSKKTVIRFEGDKYYHDRTITQNEKYGITDILNAYEYLND